MQTEEAQVILDRVYEKMSSYSHFSRGDARYQKLETREVSCRRETQGNLRRELLEALRRLPCALLEEPEEDHYTVLLNSGSGKADPAVLEIRLSDTELYLTAWAKEGLFREGAAQNAMDRVLGKLNLRNKGKN